MLLDLVKLRIRKTITGQVSRWAVPPGCCVNSQSRVRRREGAVM